MSYLAKLAGCPSQKAAGVYLYKHLGDKVKKGDKLYTIHSNSQGELDLAIQLTKEIEIVKAWKESNYSDEIIKEAIKEAVFNHVINLKYIDKILYEWKKNNIKTVKDVENNRKKRSNKKEENFANWDLLFLRYGV